MYFCGQKIAPYSKAQDNSSKQRGDKDKKFKP